MQRPNLKYTVAVTTAGVALFLGSAAITTAVGESDGTTLVPVVPVRVLDTRDPGADFDVLSAGEIGHLNLAGDVPVGALAVELNITITGANTGSFLTVWPTGEAQPTASVLNWDGPGRTDANAVAVKLGAGQQLDFINGFGDVHVIADLMGYYVDEPSVVGPQGPKGDKGDPGTDGRDGIIGQTVVTGPVTSFPAGLQRTATVNCPAGKKIMSSGIVISGDFGFFDGAPFTHGPNDAGTGWLLTGTSVSAQNVTLKAVCATIGS
jgi:hypothetical protein